MSFSVSGPKILFRIDLGFVQIPITQTTLSSFVVMVLLMIACILCGRNLKKRPGKRQVIVEKLVTMLYNMVEDTMGAHNMRFAPYMGVLFLSSLFGSLIGTTGFFRSSTADLSTTATWAIMTMLIVWYSNIREQGFFGWLKSFTDPFPVMTPLNIISEFASPISMAFRHFGNVAGGLVLTSLIYAALALLSSALFGWLPGLLGKIPFLQIGIPVPFRHWCSACCRWFISALPTPPEMPWAGQAIRRQRRPRRRQRPQQGQSGRNDLLLPLMVGTIKNGHNKFHIQ